MKQIIILRKDLKMRRGKEVAQGAHASMKATLENINDPRVKEWLDGLFTKIAVYADSLDDLMDIHNKAKEAGIITCIIEDSGLTEFKGEKTITAIAVGPDTHENLQPITGHLRLM